jgi:uncharacterized repeat protein (TIGR03837 family)
MGREWDIFCRVVDNLGDIGVCWRLARQLVAEHGARVRLWVDDVGALARIWPGVDPMPAAQVAAGIDVRHWSRDAPAPDVAPADIVVEAFACDTPESYVAAMAARPRRPAWFNLEYLSAEDWVESHHRLPSPHPRLPLVKIFFFPGFTSRTGGLLREAGVLAERDAFTASPDAADTFVARLGVPARRAGEIRVSLFAYANPAAVALLDAWRDGARPVTALVPDGVLREEIAGWAGADVAVGAAIERGSVRLVRVPFVRQTDYDRLLWACDVNFVRGEDSFVRAQWAGRPLVWHIYPQTADAHWPKLDAFLDRYTADLPAEAAGARALMHAWNGRGDVAGAWRGIAGPASGDPLRAWKEGAGAWGTRLATQTDLASQLASAAEELL